jgi:exonuclease 1
MDRVNMLKRSGVSPLLVFAGAALPAKMRVVNTFYGSKEENLKRGMDFLRQGKTREARECFVRAVEITPDVAYRLIDVSLMSIHSID